MPAIRREPGDEIALEQVAENRIGFAEHPFERVEEPARLGHAAVGEQTYDVSTERCEEVHVSGWRVRWERPAAGVPVGGERRERAAERGLEIASRHERWVSRMPNGSTASQYEAIAALLLAARLEHIIVRRDIDDANELGAQSLAGAAGCDVLRIARDPQRVESMAARQRQDQAARSLGKSLTPKSRHYLVSDVPGVVLHRVGASDTKADSPDGVIHAIEAHREPIGGNPAAHGIFGLTSAQLQPEIAVAERADVVE